ncbi:MAG: YraN family protein [Candidatus Aenigmatarchaeota archaeon]
MVKKYFKGYFAEWQLVHLLSDRGYMVIRAPRSGRISLASPDIIAAKGGRLIVIECKSRAKGFKIPMEQLDELKQWEEKACAKAYVVWKVARKGWFFLHLNDVVANNGNVGKKFIEEKAIGIDDI